MPFENFYRPSGDEPLLYSLGRGAATGGVALAGLYGLNEIRKYLVNKLFKIEPKVFPDDHEVSYFEPIIKKGGFLNELAWGAGLPLGAAAVISAIRRFNDYQEKGRLTSAILAVGKTDAELAELKAKNVKKMKDDKELNDTVDEVIKVSAYKEKKAILNEVLYPFEKLEEAYDAGKWGFTVGYPRTLGLLLGLGGLGGYYFAESISDPKGGHTDPLNKFTVNNAIYGPGYEKVKESQYIYKKAKPDDIPNTVAKLNKATTDGGIINTLGKRLTRNIADYNIGSLLGIDFKKTRSTLNTFNDIGESVNENKDLIKGVFNSGAKLYNNPIKTMLSSPGLMSTIGLAAGANAILPTLLNQSTYSNMSKKLDEISKKLNTRSSSADSKKMPTLDSKRTNDTILRD